MRGNSSDVNFTLDYREVHIKIGHDNNYSNMIIYTARYYH